jgi:hypothetical protein
VEIYFIILKIVKKLDIDDPPSYNTIFTNLILNCENGIIGGRMGVTLEIAPRRVIQ